MYRKQSVLALLALYVGLAHSFSWEIVLLYNGFELQFFNFGKLTHTEKIRLYTDRIAYDPIHNSVLMAHRNVPKMAVSSFDIITKKVQPLISKTADVVDLAFDPLTETIFWVEHNDHKYDVFSFALKPGSNNTRNGNLLVTSEDSVNYNIAVDSCGGHIYWITDINIEKARFDGSEREVVITTSQRNNLYTEQLGLAIDQEKQKLYWIKNIHSESYVMSADLNGQNNATLYTIVDDEIHVLTVSNDFIYWMSRDRATFWQFPKTLPHDRHVEPKSSIFYDDGYCSYYSCFKMAAYYKTQTHQSCETLKNLPPTVPSDYDYYDYYPNDSTDVSLLCVHGTKVSGESRCECTQGYSGERCEVPVCHNYCFDGICSVSAEGHPKCRCNVGYSGERCEFNACHEYCLDNGDCSLNEEGEPDCQCTGDYQGERCDVPGFFYKCLQTVSKLRAILNKDKGQLL